MPKCLNLKGDGHDFAMGLKSSFKPRVASEFSNALCAQDFAPHTWGVQVVGMASCFRPRVTSSFSKTLWAPSITELLESLHFKLNNFQISMDSFETK